MRFVLLTILCLAFGCAAAPPALETTVSEAPAEAAPAAPEMPAHFIGIYELVTDEISYNDPHLIRISPTKTETFGIKSGQRVGAIDGGIAYEMTVTPAEYIHRTNFVTGVEDNTSTIQVTLQSEKAGPLGPNIETLYIGTGVTPGELLLVSGKRFVKNDALAGLIEDYQKLIRVEDDLRRIYKQTEQYRNDVLKRSGILTHEESGYDR